VYGRTLPLLHIVLAQRGWNTFRYIQCFRRWNQSRGCWRTAATCVL